MAGDRECSGFMAVCGQEIIAQRPKGSDSDASLTRAIMCGQSTSVCLKDLEMKFLRKSERPWHLMLHDCVLEQRYPLRYVVDDGDKCNTKHVQVRGRKDKGQ